MLTIGDPVFTFSLPGWRLALLPPVSFATAGNPRREVRRTRAREVLGLGRMEVHRLSFSVIKPKITSVHGSCQYHI